MFVNMKDFRIRACKRDLEEGENFRLFRRKNGELVLQKEFIETTKYFDDNSKVIKQVWRDIETVNEE